MLSSPFTSKEVKYFLCVIDACTKWGWVNLLKDEKVKAVLNGFTGIVNESKCKLNMDWSR